MFSESVMNTRNSTLHEGPESLDRVCVNVAGDIDGMTSVLIRRIHRRTIEKISSEEQAEAYFTPPPFRDGDWVLDTCYGLRYMIGRPMVVVEDLSIDLRGPVRDRITTPPPEFIGRVEKDEKGRFRKKSGEGRENNPPSR